MSSRDVSFVDISTPISLAETLGDVSFVEISGRVEFSGNSGPGSFVIISGTNYYIINIIINTIIYSIRS